MEHITHRVEVVGGGDCHVIELPAEYDENVGMELDSLTSDIVSLQGPRVRIDCRQLKHPSELVIAVIFAMYTRVRRAGGRLTVDVTPGTRRIIDMTGLGFLGDDDDGLAGTRSPITPPPTPKSGQDKRVMPGPDEEIQ